ncbi:phage holin family protein [Enterobacter hormaechei]|nr:phage holin family protein [Enterobacter hormaechei]
MDIHTVLLPELVRWLNENRAALGYALTGGTMAVLRCISHGESFRTTCAEGGMCAMASFGIRELLEAMEWQPELAFPASVFLGYVGIASVLQFLRLKTYTRGSGKAP